MSDLEAFLRARLDEDEAIARDQRYVWPTDFEVTLNPARVLREVEAKRAILTEHPSGDAGCNVCHAGGWDWEPAPWPCVTVRAIAAVYRDHPDYDPAWASRGEGG